MDMATPKNSLGAAAAKAKKEKVSEEEIMLQELQKVRKTFIDVSLQFSKQLTAVTAQPA